MDGIDISFLPRDTVRERLVAIPQEPFFVSGSVRLNPGPHDVATDEQLREALRSVGLGDVLEALGGLDAQLNLDSLSHGQRQIFCRASHSWKARHRGARRGHFWVRISQGNLLLTRYWWWRDR